MNGGGILNATGGGTLSSASSKNLYSHTLNLDGTTTWAAGPIYTGGGSVITVKSGATLTTNFDGSINYNLGGNRSTLDNQGTFTKSAGTGTTNIDSTFTNSGSTNIVTGTLSLNGGGLSSGTVAITSGATLSLGSQNYAFGANASITGNGTLNLYSATTSFAGSATNSANFAFTGGTGSFSGTTVTSGNISLSSGTIGGNGTVTTAGAFNWTGGDLNGGGILNANSGGTLSSASSKNLYSHTLNLDGTTTWSAGPIYTGGGSVITVKSGATLTTNFDGSIHYNLGGNRANLDNQGTFTKSAGTGSTTVDATFTNSGTVNIVTGTLALNGGGSFSAAGNTNASANATLAFTNNYTLNNGATLGGNGTHLVSSGTLTIAGNVSASNITLAGGTIGGTGTLATTNSFIWSSGDLRDGGVLNANAGGSFASSNAKYLYDHKLNLDGSTAWSGGPIYTGGGSVITVKPGATFTTNFDGSINYNLGGNRATLDNQGTFTKSAGTGTTNIDSTFTNSGSTNIVTGTLSLNGGGLSSGTVAITSGATLSLGSQNYAFGANASITGNGTLNLYSATTSFAGSATNSANFAFTGGTGSFSGTTVTSGNISLSSGTIGGNGTVTTAGAFNWTGGDLNGGGILNATAGGAFSSANAKFLYDHKLNLDGTTTWSGGPIYTGGGSVITVKPGATFTTNFDGSINYNLGGNRATLDNQGTFTKSAGTGSTTVDATFTNSGTVNIVTGTLALNGGGSFSAAGNTNASANATLAFTNNYTLNNGATLGGNGTHLVSGGTLTIAGNVSASNITLAGGTIGGTGTLATTNSFNWSSGDLRDGGVFNANAGGTFSSASAKYLYDHKLNLDGATTWSGGPIYTGGGSLITVKSGATFTTNFDGTINYNLGGTRATLDNQGTFTKSAGTGTTTIDSTFTNSGAVNVVTGTLALNGGGLSSGTVAVSSGANLTLGGQNFAFGSNATVTGNGTITVTGATTSFAGSATNSANFAFTGGTGAFSGSTTTSGSVTLAGGTIGGNGTLTTASPFNWSYGDLRDGGVLNANAGGTLSSANAKYLYDHKLNLDGATTWSGGPIYTGGGSLITVKPGAAFTTSFDGTINYNLGGTRATLDNQGTFTKSAGTGTTSIESSFTNSGAINIVTGTLALNGGGSSSGTVAVSSGANLTLGGQNFSFAANATVTGNGTITVTGATTSFAGSATNSANFAFTGGTGAFSGSTTTSGSVTLAGGTIGGNGTLTTASPFNWSYGDLRDGGVLNANAGGTLSSANAKYLYDHKLNLDGATTWSGGPIYTGGGSLITVKPGAAFTTDFDGTVNYNLGGNRATFDNQGTFTKSAGTGTTGIDAVFTNSGTVNVVTGTLALNSGGSSSGPINVAANATLLLSGGYSIADASQLTGLGLVRLTAGVFALNGATGIGTVTLDGGQLTGTGTFANTVNWNSGDWNASAAGFSTTIASSGTLNIGSGGNKDFNYRAITIATGADVYWNSGYLRGGNGSVFTNSGTFHDKNASGYSLISPAGSGFGGTFTFVNNGTYVRDVGATTYFNAPFNNNGTINLTAGDLQFAGGGTMSSTSVVNAALGTHLYLTNNYSLADGAQLSGAGSFIQNNGTLAIDGALRASSFDWNGGDWNAAGTGLATTIANGTTLNVGNGGNKDFNGRSITNATGGTVNWQSGHLRGGNGSVFTNNGQFNDLNASGYSMIAPAGSGYGGTFTFVNNGAYVRDAGSTTTVNIPFTNNGTVRVKNGTLQFSGGGILASTATITADAGTNVMFTNGYTFNNGASLAGPGAYSLTGGAFLLSGTINVGSLTQTGGSLSGSNTINGTVNWNGGDWNGSGTTMIANGGTLNIGNGGNRDFNGRSITNAGGGDTYWFSGHLRGGSGSVFTNDGTFHDKNSSGYSVISPASSGYGGTFAFVNNGAYLRDVGATTYFNVPFNNNGTLDLTGGNIELAGGGAMSATSVVSASTGTQLFFRTSYTLADGAQFTGAGRFIQTGGTLTINGALRASSFNWTGGDWNASVAGLATTIVSGSALTLDGGGNKDFNFRNITIASGGDLYWQSGYLRGGNGSILTNNGTFHDRNASGYTVINPTSSGYGGAFTFVNNGTYIRDVGSTTWFDTTFNNNGVVNLQQGEIQLRQGGTMSATSVVNASAGTTLTITNNYSLLAGSQLLGAGTFVQTGGTLSVETLKASSFTWNGGNWNGAGTSIVDTGTILNLSSGNNKDFESRSIVNRGTVNWSSGYVRSGNGGSFTNATGGVFNDQNTSGYTVQNPFGGTFSFVNEGTYSKATTGTTTFSVPFTNTGTLSVTAGSIIFGSSFTNSGTVALGGNASAQFSGPLSLGTSTLSGTGTITAPSVTAGGLVSPGNSPGKLTLTGNLTLLSTSSLLVELGGTTQGTTYDFLSVGGNATIAGTLQLAFVNGFQGSALPGNTFTVLSAGGVSGLSGVFANVPTSGLRINTIDGFGSFQVNFTPTSVVLSNFVAVPEPSTWAMLLTGGGTLAIIGRRRKKSVSRQE